MAKKAAGSVKIARSAKTGKFVTKGHAKKSPSTTVVSKVAPKTAAKPAAKKPAAKAATKPAPSKPGVKKR